MSFIKRYPLYCAWVIALIGMMLSLYLGEVLKWHLCPLCWYQRIALFPLAILLGVAAYREDVGFARYGLCLAVLGELFAVYQVLERYFPSLRTTAICGQAASCSEVGFELFGFITLPLLSAVAFALIIALLVVAFRRK